MVGESLGRVHCLFIFVVGLAIVQCGDDAFAHGGVMMEEDECIIKFGFYKAHFTVYQPTTRNDAEFCEDLPDSGTTVFVLSYLHESLKQVPVDFRIIRDVTGLGRFTKWDDLRKLGKLDQYSVFYSPPARYGDGVLRIDHRFADTGEFVGIVTARHPSNEKIYRAVFPFQVGGQEPWALLVGLFVAGLVLLELRFRMLRRAVGKLGNKQ